MHSEWARRTSEKFEEDEYFENLTYGDSSIVDVIELPGAEKNPDFDRNLNAYQSISFKQSFSGGSVTTWVRLIPYHRKDQWMLVPSEDFDAFRAAIADRLAET